MRLTYRDKFETPGVMAAVSFCFTLKTICQVRKPFHFTYRELTLHVRYCMGERIFHIPFALAVAKPTSLKR